MSGSESGAVSTEEQQKEGTAPGYGGEENKKEGTMPGNGGEEKKPEKETGSSG